MSDFTDAQILESFREMMAKRGGGPEKFEPGKNNPLHRGVQDLNYVRPAPYEYPRMMYHATLPHKIVKDKHEQEALGSQWFTAPIAQPSDWRARASETYTKSGYRIYSHHVEFLKAEGVQGVEDLKTAAEFVDKLSEPEQEQFFSEAENVPVPEVVEEAKEVKRKKG